MSDNLTSFSLDGLRRTLSTSKDSKLLKVVDDVATVAILLSPLAAGPAAGLSALALLEAKGELKRLAAKGLDAAKSSGQVITDRPTLLSAVYCMSCYTAFFEAAETQLTKVRREFELDSTERLKLTERALLEIQSAVGSARDGENSNALEAKIFPLTHKIEIPHPTSTLQEAGNQLRRLYTTLANGLSRFISGLSAWETAEGQVKDRINAYIRDIPAIAQRKYREQYLNLCTDFNEFMVWATLNEHELTRESVRTGNVEIIAAIETLLATKDSDSVDLGMGETAQALLELKELMPPRPEMAALNDLGVVYESRISQPVIIDQMSGSTSDDLVYPRKTEIFIPQSCRALLYRKAIGSLERPQLWNKLPIHDSIAGLLLATMTNPRSLVSPILLLGHPGSGKSLLTEMLASRLTNSAYTPIRVELRDINADAQIQTQIEEQIFKDTGHRISWTTFAEQCVDRPPLVILDGYDELLQATGKVHSTYLTQVATFQQREALLKRSLRVILTSRITLIDRAEVPDGSTVMRLEEFDMPRRQAWIDTWNNANSAYFASRSLEPFSLNPGASLNELASQPLLLFMLALYDSESNALGSNQALNQTTLYHDLLVRFIDREHRKGVDGAAYIALDAEARRRTTQSDLRRLGIAAIGMFNRRALHINRAELEADIAYFGTPRDVTTNPGGVPLEQADLLLGSFFFVHESTSRTHDLSVKTPQSQAAFEFLHNTFGEFLAADFILGSVIEECRRLRILSSDSGMLNERINSGLPETTMASLIFAPLFDRPVILRMYFEWASSWKNADGVEANKYASELGLIVEKQLATLTEGSNIGSILLGQTQHPFPRHGLIYHIAVLTVNLILLRTYLTGSFTMNLAKDDADGLRWGRVHPVWRSAFGISEMSSIGRLLETTVTDTSITFSVAPITLADSRSDLQSLYLTARSVGDDLLQILLGWALQDTSEYPPLTELLDLPASRGAYELHQLLVSRSEMRNLMLHGADSMADSLLESTSVSELARTLDYRRLAQIPRFVDDSQVFIGPPEQFDAVVMNHDFADLRRSDLRRNLKATGAVFANRLSSDRLWRRRHPSVKLLRKEVDLLVWIIRESLKRDSVILGEVLLEAIVGLPKDDLLEHQDNVRLAMINGLSGLAVAARPMNSFRELMIAVERLQHVEWVEGALRSMYDKDGGPEMARQLGIFRVLSLLKFVLDIRVPDEIPEVFHGLVGFLLRNCECENPLEVMGIILHIHRKVPSWMAVAPTVEQLFEQLLLPAGFEQGNDCPPILRENLGWYLANLPADSAKHS